jgi:pyrroloquinoline quinone (PQQ) biosynthesis protein C
MPDAQELLHQIQRELAPVEARLRDHPYLLALEQGRVPRERLSVFVGEQHTTIESDLRSLATLVARSDSLLSRRLFLSILPGEDAAFSALQTLALALGLNQGWLQTYEPTPETQAYSHYVAWLAHYASPAEMAGALAVNFPAWGSNCARMGAALRQRYSLSAEATDFFSLFSGASPSQFEEGVKRVIDDGLGREVKVDQVRRAARLLQSYELMFWDGIHRASMEA